MALNRRTFFVWLISFGVLLAVYLVYTHVNETPEIKITTRGGGIRDVNGLEETGGTIGDTSPGPVQDTTFFEWVNAERTVGRQFGFARLLHKEGQEWEIEKPFMNMYFPDGTCRMTADKGIIEVEDEGGSMSVKDALMTGNVVVRVTPKAGGEMKETVAYLDDMQFFSERSLFSTGGPVRVESADFRMSGRQLEFIYNMQANRLELLHLRSLDGIYAKVETRGDSPLLGGEGSAAEDGGSEARGSESEGGEGDGGDMYRCVLERDVSIDTGTEYIVADELIIENVLLKSEDEGLGEDGNSTEASVAEAEEAAEEQREFREVVINCGGGIVIKPMSAAWQTGDMEQGVSNRVPTAQAVEAGEEVTQVTAGRIRFDATTEDCVAEGAVKVVWYAPQEDANSEGGKLPVTITAQRAQLSRAEEVIVFDGNCVCSAPMPDSAEGEPWVLRTPKVTIDMSAATEEQPPRISALGALEFSFRTDSPTGEGSDVPVKITAKDFAEFSPSLNEVVFEGDCVCAMGGEEEGGDLYSLAAPRITVALAQAADEYPEAWAAGPSEVQFLSRDIMGAGGSEEALPVTITAARGAWFAPLLNRIVFEGNCELSMEDRAGGKRQTLTSPKFTVNLPDKGETPSPRHSGDERLADRVRSLTADGPLEVNFYVEDFADANSGISLPARITAKGQGRFIPELDKVILEGDCTGIITRQVEGVREEYRFSAPVLNIDLQRDSERTEGAHLAANVRHINAGGGTVRLSVVKREGEKMLGGVELECVRFDYDTGIEAFMAVGPGMIQVDNSGIEPEAGAGRFGLRKQCFALIEDFETLDYFARSGRVVAASKAGDVSFGYIPVVNGGLGERVVGSARSVEVNLGESVEGRPEVVSLLATGGITCTKGDDIAFSGKELSYKSESSIVSVRGDAQRPCFFNGGAVNGIQWNVKTDEFKFRIPGPGMF